MSRTLLTLLVLCSLSLSLGLGAFPAHGRNGCPALCRRSLSCPTVCPLEDPRPASLPEHPARKALLTDGEVDTDDLAASTALCCVPPLAASAANWPGDDVPSFGKRSAPLYLSLRTLLL